MPIRVPYQTVRVRREDKNIIPPIGVPFDFTAEEIEAIDKASDQALRRAINERVGVPTEVTSQPADEDADDPVKVEETPKAPARSGGLRKRAAGGEDDEL